jgi:hypothetical protein
MERTQTKSSSILVLIGLVSCTSPNTEPPPAVGGAATAGSSGSQTQPGGPSASGPPAGASADPGTGTGAAPGATNSGPPAGGPGGPGNQTDAGGGAGDTPGGASGPPGGGTTPTGAGAANGGGPPAGGTPMPPACQTGEKQCTGAVPRTCENGMWSPGTECANGCLMGTCCGDGTEAGATTCDACGKEGQACCKVAKPACQAPLTCDPTKNTCVAPCGPGFPKCCKGDTKVCSKNCGRTGMQVCDANGNWGNCSISDLPGCPGDPCGKQSCSGGTEKSPGRYDSKGNCNQDSHKCKGGLTCDGNKCATSCDCGQSFTSCKGCPSGHYCGNDLKSCPAQKGENSDCGDPVECKAGLTCSGDHLCVPGAKP